LCFSKTSWWGGDVLPVMGIAWDASFQEHNVHGSHFFEMEVMP
jgi:hypothetical protein